MNKQMTPEEVSRLLGTDTAMKAPPMSRTEKLLHWAKAVAHYPRPILMGTGLEHMRWDQLMGAVLPHSIYDVAAADPTFRAMGLDGRTVGASVEFFELSQNEVHFLTCDCHGTLSNQRMGEYIEHIAECDCRRF
jgi:hypothetical protein